MQRRSQLISEIATSREFLDTAAMHRFPFPLFAILLLLGLVASPARAADISAAEKAKIESLISGIENLAEAKFIRNGTSYDAKTAAKFLRGKWGRNEDEIKTAKDFIAKAATASGTSGKPYMIQLKGAGEVPCADYLTEQLKKLESK